LIAALLLAAPTLQAAEDTSIKKTKFTFDQKTRINEERERDGHRVYQHWGNKTGVFKARFVEMKAKTVVLEDSYTKEIMEIPLFYFSAPDLCYLRNMAAKFPDKMVDHEMKPARRKLIDISAEELELGLLTGPWKNHGVLNGAFHNLRKPATVVEIEGRKGVRFSHASGRIMDPDYQGMTSDFTITGNLGFEQPFTVSAWVYMDVEKREDGHTIINWHSIGGGHGNNIAFQGASSVGGIGSPCPPTIENASKVDTTPMQIKKEWQHITHVYTGGHDGELRLYINGELKTVAKYDVKVNRLPVEDITATTATIKGELFSRESDGKAPYNMYWGERDHKGWQQMRHWHWDNLLAIPRQDAQPGVFAHTIEGLKPGTRYFFRIATQANNMEHVSWGYGDNHHRHWAFGPGSFVTATEDGKPGYNIPDDNRRHFFIGCLWDTYWYAATPGPSGFARGVIGNVRVYDYALTDAEVRGELGAQNAFKPSPENHSEHRQETVRLAWELPVGCERTASFKVYHGDDKEAVENGSITPIETKELSVEGIALERLGARYYWRVEQLDATGTSLVKGEVWDYQLMVGMPQNPSPTNNAIVNPVDHYKRLNWRPGPRSKEQRLYVARSREALDAIETPIVIKGKRGRNKEDETLYPQGSYGMPRGFVKHGETYYWRVDTLREDGRLTVGPVWTFSYSKHYTPEIDHIWAEPVPDDIRGSTGAKVVQTKYGAPALVAPSAPTEAAHNFAVASSRFFQKSRAMWYLNTALGSRITYGKEPGSFAGGWPNNLSYGSMGMNKDFNKEHVGLLQMHEMGHGASVYLAQAAPGNDMLFYNSWLNQANTLAGLGNYGANNIGERLAVTGQGYISAASRDALYKNGPMLFDIWRRHVGGDTHIDLNPTRRTRVNPDSSLASWGNDGGLLEWDNWHYIFRPDSTGEFTPLGGAPIVTTVEGVSAVKLDGNSALLWDQKTRFGLYGNRDFTIELWARKDANGSADAVLAGWGGAESEGGIQFKWSDFKNAQDGKWHHLIQVFEGGGFTTEEEGAYRVYVDGKVVVEEKRKFNLAKEQPVYVGGFVAGVAVVNGFKGSLGQVRIHNYDLSPEQIADHYSEEAPSYNRQEMPAVAETLYVDLDARRINDLPQVDHRPVYPKHMRKPWLRSWSNRGTLGGRVHNDIHSYMWGYSGSTPLYKMTAGITAPNFQGKDRMVGGFAPSAEMVEGGVGTIEVWARSSAESPDEIILEWGAFQVESGVLGKASDAWRHIAYVFSEKTAVLYVDGKRVEQEEGAPAIERFEPEFGDRLNIGGHFHPVAWNWRHYFNGAIAAIRVHKGPLTPQQVAANAAQTPKDFPPPEVEKKLLIDLDASKLTAGKSFTKWNNAGTAGGAFVPGKRGAALAARGRLYAGEAGLITENGRVLKSTFPVPACLKKGPFTIAIRTEKPLRTSGLPLLNWGNVTLWHGTWNADIMTWPVEGKEPTPEEQAAIDAVDIEAGNGKRRRDEMTKRFTGQACFPLHPLDIPVGTREFDEKVGHNISMGYLWRNIVLSYDDKTFRYYVNGHLKREKKVAFNPTFTEEDLKSLRIGGKYNRGAVILQSLKVYNSALSHRQIQTLHEGKEPAGRALQVDVSFAKYRDAEPILREENKGKLGGAFAIAADVDHTPDEIKSVDGVQALWFDGKTDFLQSTGKMPKEFELGNPFTVEVMVYQQNGQAAAFQLAETISRPNQPSANNRRAMTFMTGDLPGFSMYPSHHPSIRFDRPKPGEQTLRPRNRWVVWTFVFEGGYRGKVRGYVDGEKRLERSAGIATLPGCRMTVGGEFATRMGESNLFQGGVARIRAWSYAQSSEEIRARAKALLKPVEEARTASDQ